MQTVLHVVLNVDFAGNCTAAQQYEIQPALWHQGQITEFTTVA